MTPHLTVNYGLRYQTSFGLFEGSGRTQLENPAFLTLQALDIPLPTGSAARTIASRFGPRLGIAYRPGQQRHDGDSRRLRPVLQRSRAERLGARHSRRSTHHPDRALQQVRELTGGLWVHSGQRGGRRGNLIDSNYKTPYAIHVTGGVQHAFNQNWALSADYTHEQGNHGYRGYASPAASIFSLRCFRFRPDYAADQASVVPNMNLFKSDNRSSYNALMVHLARQHVAPLQSDRQLHSVPRHRPGVAFWANSSTT